MNKERIYGLIGVAAFVVGGILARNRALDACEEVEEFFTKKTKPAPEIQPEPQP